MKRFLLAVFLLALFVTACGGVPQSVQNRPIESYLDPNTKLEDKESLLQILALVTPEARDDITFLTAKGSVYSTSEQARKAGALLKPAGENIFELPDGSFRAFPASGESPNNQNLTATGEPFSALDDCYRKGIGEKSGPIRRITHAQGTKQAPTNWMKVTLYLPKAAEANGFKQRIADGKTMKPVYNAPFIYAGGWGNKGSGQSYVDAGFQMSTGDKNNDASDEWTLFVKASGVVYLDKEYSKLGQVSDKKEYRFAGGSTVDLTFFNLSDLLIATAKEQGSNRSRVIALRLANNSRWSGDGIGNWYKMMTTIGQGRVEPSEPVQKLDSVGFLKNAAIKNMEIGYIDWGVLDKILRREIPEGEANVFGRDNVTIEPRVGNGSKDQRKKFMNSGEFTDCKFPDDRAANDFRFDVTGNTNLIYDKAVQVVKTSDGELTSIDLRTPTSLQLAEDKLPVSKSAWIPAIPNQTDQPLPSATPDITVKLKGKPKASGSTVKTLFFQNYGSLNSLLEFRAYPIGQVDTDTNLQKALDRKGQTGIVLWGNKSTNANELEDIASLSQLATKPPKSPWADGLYAARSTVNLRRPNNIRMTRGIDQTKLEIEATCPEKPESTPYKARFPIIYSTGLADDGVTPETPANQKFSTVDDEPQKRVMWVNLELECIVPAKIAINPTPISLTGNVGSSTNTQNLTISNTGDLDSTLEYKQFFVSENTLDSSLLNPSPIAGAALRPLAVVVPPSLENSLIRASGFSPSSISTGELKVLTEGTPVSSTVSVSYFCSSAGTFTRYINVVYKTGATDEAGIEILENAVVSVEVTCVSVEKPKILISKTQVNIKAELNSYNKIPLIVKNIGTGILEYNGGIGIGNRRLNSGEAEEINITFFCGTFGDSASDYIIQSNDTENIITFLEIKSQCFGDFVLKDQPLVYFYAGGGDDAVYQSLNPKYPLYCGGDLYATFAINYPSIRISSSDYRFFISNLFNLPFDYQSILADPSILKVSKDSNYQNFKWFIFDVEYTPYFREYWLPPVHGDECGTQDRFTEYYRLNDELNTNLPIYFQKIIEEYVENLPQNVTLTNLKYGENCKVYVDRSTRYALCADIVYHLEK